MQHTVTYDKYQYVVNCARETHCAYVKTTIFITKVLDRATGNPVQYPKRTVKLKNQIKVEYFTQEESMIRHLQNMMLERELAYVMGAAERHFAQQR